MGTKADGCFQSGALPSLRLPPSPLFLSVSGCTTPMSSAINKKANLLPGILFFSFLSHISRVSVTQQNELMTPSG